MWKPDLCIYHGNCDDGFGAAWAIWKRWGNEVAYIPGVYGKPLPDGPGVKNGDMEKLAREIATAI